jgi:serine/threonine protein kinase
MSGFLPVKAFFMADPSGQARPEWHLITPFLSGGNLNDLAKRLRGHHPYKHFHEVDSAYRPAFNNLLRVLESLHSRGFCHDDIKPSNIFLQSDTNWILGDLGNVRQIDHLYHSSRLWVQDNSQLADCRANDSLRALKSYLQFIRAASDDFEAFEGEIFAGRETLSRLFWWAIADASSMGAAELRIRSEIEDPRQTSSQRSTVGVHTKPYYSFLLGKRKSLSIAVDQALRTSFSERAARWAAMSWLFGIPVERCA